MKKRSKTKTDVFEIEFYEGLLEKKPDFEEALSALGDLYTKIGEYQKGLEIDRRLQILRPDDPVVLYNLSCSYSLLNDVDASFETIKRAIDCGYDEIALIEKDEDLDNLRKDKRFQEYFQTIKEKR